jgi:hypothetical protein
MFFKKMGLTGFDGKVNRLVSMSSYEVITRKNGTLTYSWQLSICHGSLILGVRMPLHLAHVPRDFADCLISAVRCIIPNQNSC